MAWSSKGNPTPESVSSTIARAGKSRSTGKDEREVRVAAKAKAESQGRTYRGYIPREGK